MADYYLGLMSGTSMDGIDAALVACNATQIKLVCAAAFPWDATLQSRLRQASHNQRLSLIELGELDQCCAEQFAQAALELLQQCQLPPHRIRAIGSHGQTLYHHPHPPHPFTLQLGDPNLIAERTGITVVADFRRRDMAAGGQGAPLVPAFHQAWFGHPHLNRVILNIGGIANLSILPAKQSIRAGFDTGPGNCLMDYWIHTQQQQHYDRDGKWAQSGTPCTALLEHLLADPYFSLAPPKSTGTEYFSPAWLKRHLSAFSTLPPQDVQATLLELTTQSIHQAIRQWAPHTHEIWVCGGGVHNTALMQRLGQLLPGMQVASTAFHRPALDPDWIEAAAFAWLAQQTLNHRPGNIPRATGAKGPRILGGIYFGHNPDTPRLP